MRVVYLHTLEWNIRAQKAFAKSGFLPIKSIRRNGLEFLLMEIKRKDWQTVHESKIVDSDRVSDVEGILNESCNPDS